LEVGDGERNFVSPNKRFSHYFTIPNKKIKLIDNAELNSRDKRTTSKTPKSYCFKLEPREST